MLQAVDTVDAVDAVQITRLHNRGAFPGKACPVRPRGATRAHCTYLVDSRGGRQPVKCYLARKAISRVR